MNEYNLNCDILNVTKIVAHTQDQMLTSCSEVVGSVFAGCPGNGSLGGPGPAGRE